MSERMTPLKVIAKVQVKCPFCDTWQDVNKDAFIYRHRRWNERKTEIVDCEGSNQQVQIVEILETSDVVVSK